MIFRQVKEIREGTKTQTRRIVKSGEAFGDRTPGEITVFKNHRVKWETSRQYAVVAKRGSPCVLIAHKQPYGNVYAIYGHKDGNFVNFPDYDWRKLKIEITDIRLESLQSITEADARAEGVESVAEYRELWDSINTSKGTRWEDNPLVWVISFKSVEV